MRGTIERTLKKNLLADRSAHAEDDQLTYKVILHELLKFFEFDSKSTFILLSTNTWCTLLERNAGIEYAKAIEKIAHKILEITTTMKGNISSLQILEELSKIKQIKFNIRRMDFTIVSCLVTTIILQCLC